MILLAAPQPAFTPPRFEGDPEVQGPVVTALAMAFADTAAYGPWPGGAWVVRVHAEARAFEQATGAPPGRAAQWTGNTLHLRPWDQLRRRDLGAVLRHELVHRRLAGARLRRWAEEARCLHAEAHRRPPARWPDPPSPGLQDRLDRALAGGTTGEQAWAYRWLRAWLLGDPTPVPPRVDRRQDGAWTKESLSLGGDSPTEVTVAWPPERLRGPMVVNGHRLSNISGRQWRFEGTVRFGAGFPVETLRGQVRIRAGRQGWSLRWTAPVAAWVAAATEGELGADAPFEARRALAAVLARWLAAHRHAHPGGALCPLTHCAVVRGSASPETVRAVATAPGLDLDPRWAFFTGSAGGRGLSPRAVWGEGPADAGTPAEVPGDRWASWTRTLSAAQVAALKRDVAPGLRAGQAGLRLGGSGPYPVEALRLAAGRRFGWTAWPSNACEAEPLPDGGLRLQGRGWGHNVGLCLATARFRAAQGATAEQILAEAFPATWRSGS